MNLLSTAENRSFEVNFLPSDNFSKLSFSYNSRESFVHFLHSLCLQNLNIYFPVHIFLTFYVKNKFKIFSHL